MHGSGSPQDVYAQAHRAFEQGRPQVMHRLLGELLKIDPGHAEGWNLSGLAHHLGGDFEAAIGCYRRAVAAGAGAGALTNLGFAHQKLGQLELAASAYKQALRVDPGLSLAWQKLGGLLELQKECGKALDCYRRAFQLDPADLKSMGDALFLRRHMADWSTRSEPTPHTLLETLATAQRSDLAPLLLLALPEADAQAQRHAASLFARSRWGHALTQPAADDTVDAEGRRLRVGYFSSDFRDHALSYLALEAIAAHDRSAVEVFLYSHGPALVDRWRSMAMQAGEHFIDVDRLDDHATAARIRSDGIDVLVDLNGYTRDGRPGVTALRPAPVIASWLGYIGSLGEPGMADYIIGDAVATPGEMEGQFSESLALLPDCFQPNGRLHALLPAPSRSSQGLPEDAVVFCSFNQTFKLHPQLWDDWCGILRDVPGSVLWLAPPREQVAIDSLRSEAALRGVEPSRLVFASHQDRDTHLARLALADLALDTYPYNSGTTASDALRAGVPLLAFPGTTFAGRMAASILNAAGLDECVLPDRQAYVARAIELGNQPALLASLRGRLKSRIAESTLFRPEACARALEQLYARMHAQRLAGLRGTVAYCSAE